MVLADGVRTDEAAGAAGAGAAGAGQRGPAWLGLVPLRRPGPRRRTSSRRPSSTVTVCSSLPTSSSWRDHDVPAQESFACTCPAFWIYLHDFVAAVSEDVDELSGWFARSYEWTATLRPTPKRT
jgi:hypothetical protein